jgi:hypothetical protein
MLDAILHHAPNALRDVKEVLLETLVLGTHVSHSSIRDLAERLQLYL